MYLNDNFVKKNIQNFQEIPPSFEILLDSTVHDDSNINIVTNNEISNCSNFFNYIDNPLIWIIKQVCKNNKTAKAEFDTFLNKDIDTKICTTSITSPEHPTKNDGKSKRRCGTSLQPKGDSPKNNKNDFISKKYLHGLKNRKSKLEQEIF